MKVGLNVMGMEAIFGGDVAPVFDAIAAADAAGVDVISTCDHLGFHGPTHAERVRTHGFPYTLDQPWFEPISFLSAAAARSRRARLSTFVLVAPLRPALLLAKQLATLDVISGGRVTIGLGVGWQELEFAAAGMPFEGRFAHLEEMVLACRALWRSAPASFNGEHVRFDNFHALPLPVQRDRLPVLFGVAPGPRNFERIARAGDGWAVNPVHMDGFADHVRALRAAFSAAGRDPNAIEIETQLNPVRDGAGAIDWDATAATARAWAAQGSTTIGFLAVQFCRTPEDVEQMTAWMTCLKQDGI